MIEHSRTGAVSAAFLLALIAVPDAALADPAVITPRPREMSLARRTVSTRGGAILLAGTHPKLRVAAEEINQRLTEELLADALPVRPGGLGQIRGAAGPVFVIGVSGKGNMAAIEQAYRVRVPRKKQGYGIASHRRAGRLVMVLAGRDPQGALYAAVTLRYLLDPADGSEVPNGGAVVHQADVRDWPDFVWRQVGRPPANVGIGWELKAAVRGKSRNLKRIGDRYTADCKLYVDYMLRHKINLSWTHVTHLFNGPAGQSEYARIVSDYARARGVDFVEKTMTYVGRHPQDKDDPRKSRCVDHRVHRQYFCWSLLDVHEERAREIAKFMKESGIRWLYLHATDGGGWQNPARWNDRCEHCRRMYGDDHAKADAAMFGTYYRLIKREIPDFKMIAVVYPYNAGSIDPKSIEGKLIHQSGAIPNAKALAGKIADQHQRFLTRLGELLPPEIFICQREVVRDQYALMTKCYGRRNFQIYLELKHGRAWNPEFTTASGWLGTFYRPGYEDVFYPSDCAWALNYMSELMSAEFGWNVNAPGAREFTGGAIRQYDIDHHIEPRDITRRYIERFCSDFYGAEIGPYMVPVYDSNISYRFIQRPRELIGRMRLQDGLERMKQMAEATGRAMASLEEARKVYDAAARAGRKPIPNELGARMFGEMYRAVLAARGVAAYRVRMLQARPAVIAGEMDKAKQLVAEMRDIIAGERAEWGAHWPWMRRIPINRRRNPNWVYTFGQFHEFDHSKLEDEVAKFEKEMDGLFEAYNTPKWFKRALAERVLYAVPVSSRPTIDGRLDEEIWAKAPKNEFFVDHKTSTPAEKETEARILYDNSGLYIGFTAYEPGADKIRIVKRKRDDHNWNQTHSVELFVDASGDKETYVHYIWGIDESILDGRRIRDANGMLKMDNKGFTSRAEFAVARYPDRWTLEARVPAEELGKKPRSGRTWRANLCRNLARSDGKREATSTVMMEGSSFHTPAKFSELRLLPSVSPDRKPIINFLVDAKRAGQVTIGDGTGYEVLLDISLDTTKPLHDASLRAEVYSGEARKGAFDVFENRDVQLLWRSREPVRHLVKTPEPGLDVDFHLTSREGSWTFRRKFGRPRSRAIKVAFTEGTSGKALAGTACFPAAVGEARLFDSRQGTLEMWVKVVPPLATEVRFGPDPQHVFFFQGPIRFDHPLLDNRSSVCLQRRGPHATGRLSTGEFQQVWTNAWLGGWQKEGWRHVAAQWSAVDENRLSFEIYLDGRKASKEARTNLRDRKWRKRSESFFVQLGSMITGAAPLGWAIDEVRVSSAPRYKENFAPAKRAQLDGLATVVFHFDGNLTGQTRRGKAVTANGGPGL